MQKSVMLIGALAFLSAASTALTGTAAIAAEHAMAASAATPAPNWTGFYLGANLGYGWKGSENVTFSPNDPSTLLFSNLISSPPVSFNSAGTIGGLQLGYNWQPNRNWLVGAETDLNFSGIKGSGTTNFVGLAVPFSSAADERVKWFGTVRARLGYLPMDNLLAYVTGGLAYGRVEQNASIDNASGTRFIFNVGGYSADCFGNTTCFAGSSTRTAVGWTLGGGLEYAVWQNWTVKAEYLYVDLGSKDFNSTATRVFPGLGLTPASFTAQFDHTQFHVARVGVNYKF